MSSAGRSGKSGKSDTERTNPIGRDNPTGTPPNMSAAAGMGGPLMPEDDVPVDQIEMVEIMEVEDLTGDTQDMGPAGFRWWYVPAIGLPLGVGTGAAVWYLTKGAEPYQNAWELMSRPVRNLSGQPGQRTPTKRAMRTASARARARASATSATLRGRVADVFSGFDATDLTEKAGGIWEDARDSMVDLWDQVTDPDRLGQARETADDARMAAQRQLGKIVGNIAAAAAALAVRKKINDLFNAAQEKTKANRATTRDAAQRARGRAWFARNRTQGKVSGLTDSAKQQLAKQTASAKAMKSRGARTAKKTSRRVTTPFRRVGTFALATLVTAMIIYVRSWYARRNRTTGMSGGTMSGMSGIGTEDVRETASGRMEPDNWPRFADRMPDATAPRTTSSPTEP